MGSIYFYFTVDQFVHLRARRNNEFDNIIFQDFLDNFIVVFIDDILVYHRTREEYE